MSTAYANSMSTAYADSMSTAYADRLERGRLLTSEQAGYPDVRCVRQRQAQGV